MRTPEQIQQEYQAWLTYGKATPDEAIAKICDNKCQHDDWTVEKVRPLVITPAPETSAALITDLAKVAGLTPDTLTAVTEPTSANPATLAAAQEVHSAVKIELAPGEDESPASNAEIILDITSWMMQGKIYPDIKPLLVAKYDDSFADFDELYRGAHQKIITEVDAAQAHEDQMCAIVDDTQFDNTRLWLENWCLRNRKKMPTDPAVINEYARNLKRAEEAEKRHTARLLSQLSNEALPEFPQMSGALHDLTVAICPDLPYEFKFMAAATYWGLIRSGIDVLAGERNLQTRFDICLIAPPGTGKTASTNETNFWMSPLIPKSMLISTSVDSGPSLVDEFNDLRNQWPTLDRLRVLLSVDEMKGLFEKAKSTVQSRNSLSDEFLKLFEGNVTGNRARHSNKGKRIAIDNAHLAILGGCTPEGYQAMWTGTGGGATGLQSRFIPITTNNPPLPVNRRPSDKEAAIAAIVRLQSIAEKPGQVISIDNEAQQMLSSWWHEQQHEKASTTRVDDFIKRMAIILAVTNNVTTVGKDLMAQTIKFGTHIIAVREKFNPADSYSWVQAFETSIAALFKKHPGRAFTKNEARQLLHVDRKPGGLDAFLRAWKNSIEAEVIKQDGLTIQGTARYKFNQ